MTDTILGTFTGLNRKLNTTSGNPRYSIALDTDNGPRAYLTHPDAGFVYSPFPPVGSLVLLTLDTRREVRAMTRACRDCGTPLASDLDEVCPPCAGPDEPDPATDDTDEHDAWDRHHDR